MKPTLKIAAGKKKIKVTITSPGELERIINNKTSRARKALQDFLKYGQRQIDDIVKQVAKEALKNREKWAELAFKETQLGVYEDKILKNLLATEGIYNYLRDKKTVGIVKRDAYIYEVAEPVGVIAAFLPCTNPTSTPIAKILTALKTRNPIIFSPHPRSLNASRTVCAELYAAALKAGAPEGCIQCFDEVSKELAWAFMKHNGIDIIWATGGSSLVKAAYSSGKPCYAGGSGNVPSYIEKTADVESSVYNILMDKMFDNSSTCTSTKGLIVDREIYSDVENHLKGYGAYILSAEEVNRIEDILIDKVSGLIKGEFVAVSAARIAEAAGISVPAGTKVLAAPIEECADLYRPIEVETTTALFKLYMSNSVDDGIRLCERLLKNGGIGHTANLYTSNNNVIDLFGRNVTAGKININMPSTLGAATDIYTPRIPTFTLACGTWGNNMTTDNINYQHFLNIKRIGQPRPNLQPFRAPRRIYVGMSVSEYFSTLGVTGKRALVVTDPVIAKLPFFASFSETLSKTYADIKISANARPDPDMKLVDEVVDVAREFRPDVVIALGGGSPIDLAKMVRLRYDNPEVSVSDLCLPFMDIGKKLIQFADDSIKTELICIPTTAGTGSEVTCAAVVTDPETHIKHAIFDFKTLFADVVILDGAMVKTLPKKLVAETGFDALVHAVEAYVSIANTPETDNIALKAIRTIYSNLYDAVRGSEEARAQMLYAASNAGIAITNAFVGVNHALGHQLGGAFGIPHGASLAVFFLDVIRFNFEMPYKLTGLPTYARHKAPERYARIAKEIGIGTDNVREAVDQLCTVFGKLIKDIEIPARVSEYGVKREDYEKKINGLAKQALCDICLGTNPRGVLLEDLEKFFKNAY